jgi:carbon-monoxide dehydrogenase large subunit
MAQETNRGARKPSDRGPYIGQPLPRFEDLRLVRGKGRYTDDISLPEETYAAFVRSPHAHARILRIDKTAALGTTGALAVLTGEDYLADGYLGVPHMPNPVDAIDVKKPAYADGPVLDQPHLPLVVERVRHVGEPVAIVVASSQADARSAAELVVVEYEALPAVTDIADALAPGAPAIWNDAVGNVAVAGATGDQAAVLTAIENADCVVSGTFRNQRIANAQMEPRSALGSYDAETDQLILISGSQGVHRIRNALAHCFKHPSDKVQVLCPDVGGGFGPRTNVYPEQVAVVYAARRIGRPVKWTSDRTEAFLTDYQGRDFLAEGTLALDRDGRIVALKVDLLGAVGAQTVAYVPMNNSTRIATTVYDVPAAHMRIRGVITNTVSTAPYRGAGRPEAVLVMEGLLDRAAKQLGIDRLEIRRRNLLRPEQFPYRTPMGLTYDAGDFAGNMRRALETADWNGFPARRAEAEKRGNLAGIGFANYIESPVGAPHERVKINVLAEGVVELLAGTQATGQGHETTYAQVLADLLGVTPEEVRLSTGDSARLASGGGSHSVRSMRLAGALMVRTSAEVRAQAARIAAALLGVKESEIAFTDGLFATPNSNRRLTVFDIARAIDNDPSLPADLRKPLSSEAAFTGRMPAFPTGAAVCEVEVDPDTGLVLVRRYTAVDDVGQPINPLILHGQVHGGIVQGLGQALWEAVVHDDGQVVTASFMDYGMPRADMLPSFDLELTEAPTKGNPLRVKGGGESGITPSLAATINAIADALAPLGVQQVEMPATPYRVWSAIQQARAAPHARDAES